MIAASVLLLFTLALIMPMAMSYQATPKAEPPLVSCTTAYVGDVNVYLETIGSVLPPAPPTDTQDNSRIAVAFELPEDQVQRVLRKLNAKQPMIVEAYDRTMQKKIGEGLFTAMDNQIDAGAGTVRCKAIIKAPEDIALLTNMSLNIRVRMETKQAVTLLPLQAVQYRGQGSFVYLIRENKRVTVQP